MAFKLFPSFMPKDLKERYKTLKYYLEEGNVTEALRHYDGAGLKVLKDKNPTETKKNKKLFGGIALLEKAAQAQWRINNRNEWTKDDMDLLVRYDGLSDEILKDQHNPHVLKMKTLVAKELSGKYQSRYDSDPYIEETAKISRGRRYAWDAVKGYSRLKMLTECTEALRDANQYFGLDDNTLLSGQALDFMDLAKKVSDLNTKDEITLVEAAIKLTQGKDAHLSLEQKKMILDVSRDEDVKIDVLDSMGLRKEPQQDYDARNKFRGERIDVLLAYAKTKDGKPSTSQKHALELLLRSGTHGNGFDLLDTQAAERYGIERTQKAFELLFEEMRQGSEAALEIGFKDAETTANTLYANYFFRGQHLRDQRKPELAKGQIPIITGEEKGPGIAKARNHFAKQLFDQAEEKRGHAFTEEGYLLADQLEQATRLTGQILVDESLPEKGAEKQAAMFRLREVILLEDRLEKEHGDFVTKLTGQIEQSTSSYSADRLKKFNENSYVVKQKIGFGRVLLKQLSEKIGMATMADTVTQDVEAQILARQGSQPSIKADEFRLVVGG